MHHRRFGDTTAAGISPATSAAGLAISGEDVPFLVAAIALMSRKSPDHANTGLQATLQNLIVHSGKQD